MFVGNVLRGTRVPPIIFNIRRSMAENINSKIQSFLIIQVISNVCEVDT